MQCATAMMEWHSPNKVGVHTKKANTLAKQQQQNNHRDIDANTLTTARQDAITIQLILHFVLVVYTHDYMVALGV
jgi:hypothetical protein